MYPGRWQANGVEWQARRAGRRRSTTSSEPRTTSKLGGAALRLRPFQESSPELSDQFAARSFGQFGLRHRMAEKTSPPGLADLRLQRHQAIRERIQIARDAIKDALVFGLQRRHACAQLRDLVLVGARLAGAIALRPARLLRPALQAEQHTREIVIAQ